VRDTYSCGSDDSSVYQSGDVCLGHRRLSIIDLSTSDQPIFNNDKTLVIVYNGEIYNYRELLEGSGFKEEKFDIGNYYQ